MSHLKKSFLGGTLLAALGRIMKLNADDLIGLDLTDAKGQKLGKTKDLLFDDREWKVRYVVVDTGTWLKDRLILITPDQTDITPEAIEDGDIPCHLTKITIEGCPPLAANAPVSRRYELEMANYFKTNPYWLGSPVWGVGDSKSLVPPSPRAEAQHEEVMDEIEKCHVRSAKEVTGYEVLACNDVSLGTVAELEIAWESRAILNITAAEGGLLKKTEERNITPARVAHIDWATKRVLLRAAYDDDQLIPTLESPVGMSPSTATS